MLIKEGRAEERHRIACELLDIGIPAEQTGEQT
jgi:hypothetical protein